MAWQRANPKWRSASLERQRAARPHQLLAKYLFHNAKGRAKSQGLPFTITRKWIEDHIAGGFCAVTGKPFVYDANSPFIPSIDQKLPGLGYTEENAQIVVWIYNAAKQDWGHEAVLELARSLVVPLSSLAPTI